MEMKAEDQSEASANQGMPKIAGKVPEAGWHGTLPPNPLRQPALPTHWAQSSSLQN